MPPKKSQLHLAGIIPVSGIFNEFGFPWHPSLNPISENYLAIERSVVECATAGCKTIWLVCNDDLQPLVKDRLGDYIEDLYCLEKANFVNFPTEHRKQIPIFYVPIHPKDRKKRDSLGWSILHGALTSFIIGNKISKWLPPDRYFVSFPYAVVDPKIISNYRSELFNENGFFYSHKGRTIKDGELLPFTFGGEDYKRFKRDSKEQHLKSLEKGQDLKKMSMVDFGLDKIFKSAMISNAVVVNIQDYFPILNWDSWQKYFASSFSKNISASSLLGTKKHIYRKIRFNEER